LILDEDERDTVTVMGRSAPTGRSVYKTPSLPLKIELVTTSGIVTAANQEGGAFSAVSMPNLLKFSYLPSGR